MQEIYFDNGATTKPLPEVIQEVVHVMENIYGNPSSLHKMGVQAEKIITDARQKIASILKVNDKEIYFTSGGTESNNLAILGMAKAYQRSGKHIITTKVEHPSVLDPFAALEKEGFTVTYIGVDAFGAVKKEELVSAVQKDTILVSIMHVNNEVGAINNIEEIGKAIKTKNPETLFHVDAIQSFGKFQMHPNKVSVDALSMSSHKIHGPKGVGALYIKKGTKIVATSFGGGQEHGMRSGTENVPGIAGFSKAIQAAYASLAENTAKVLEIKEALYAGLKENFKDMVLMGPDIQSGSPYILNVAFPGIRSEVLLHALEDKNIYVSSGSACSSNKPKKSHVLTAMQVEAKCIDSSIRFSFSKMNTVEEALQCIEEMKPMMEMLKRFKRR